jgi:hypothetical protein
MATNDITAASILSATPGNGWVLRLRVEGWAGKIGAITYNTGWAAFDAALGNNPNVDIPRLVLNLETKGYRESAGAPDLKTDLPWRIYGSRAWRLPHPNQTTPSETVDGSDLLVDITLSDYVYVGDANLEVTILAGLLTSGSDTNNAVTDLAVTNNSTVAYPKVKAFWVDKHILPGERLGTTYQGALHAAHVYGVNGTLFTVTDESSNAANQYVTAQQSLACSRGPSSGANRLPNISAHVASLNVQSLTVGQLGTARARAYPRRGDATSVFDSNAFGNNDPALRNRPHRIQSNASWPDVFAYVNAASPSGSPVASTTAATARAAPFADPWAAVLAARDFINTNLSRSANLDGAVIRLMDNSGSPQDYAWGRTSTPSSISAPGAFPVIEPDPLNTAKVRFTSKATTANIRCNNVIIKVPLEPASGQQSNFLLQNTTDTWYVVAGTEVVSVQTTSNSLVASGVENATFIDCLIKDNYGGMFDPKHNIWSEIQGWEQTATIANGRCIAGTRFVEGVNCFLVNSAPSTLFNWSASTVTNNAFVSCIVDTNSNPWQGTNQTNTLIEQCVWRKNGSLAVVTTDSKNASDCLYLNITGLNCRFNRHNEDPLNLCVKEREFFIGCAFASTANKHDTYGNDGTLTGAWANSFGVTIANSYNGRSQFPFDWDGLHMWVIRDSGSDPPTDPALESDFTPSTGSAVRNLIRAGTAAAAFDIYGTAYRDDGTDAAGAVNTEADNPPPAALPRCTTVSISAPTSEGTGIAWDFFPPDTYVVLEEDDVSQTLTYLLTISNALDPGMPVTIRVPMILMRELVSRLHAFTRIEIVSDAGASNDVSAGLFVPPDIETNPPTTTVFEFVTTGAVINGANLRLELEGSGGIGSGSTRLFVQGVNFPGKIGQCGGGGTRPVRALRSCRSAR